MKSESTFLEFSNVIQLVSSFRDKTEKVELLKSYIETLSSIESQKLVLRFLCDGAFPSQSVQKITLGNQTIAKAAARFLEMDYDYVFISCKKATGDIPETIEKLMEAWPNGISKRNPKPVLLAEISTFFDDLAVLKSVKLKENHLFEMWKNLTAIEIKYLLRIMQSSSIHCGLEELDFLQIIAQIFQKPISDVLNAHKLTRSIEQTLQNSAENKLESVTFSYFRPLDFMSPIHLESQNFGDFKSYFCEESFDGKRCQIHVRDKEIQIFGADLKDISSAFPDVCSFFLEKNCENLILDGVLVSIKNETILPFSETKLPATFIAFDLIAHKSELITNQTFLERRKILEKLAQKYCFSIPVVHKINSEQELTNRLNWAILHGNKGLILKKLDSIYDFGAKKSSWIKINQLPKSLICVLLYAHSKNGNRAELYSDFTLGIRSQVLPEYFVPICKINIDLNQEDINQLNAELKPLIADRFGPTLGLIPKIVIEISFDEVLENRRTKAGFGLKNAQFKTIRWDLELKNVQTLQEINTLFAEQRNQTRMGNSIEPFMLKR